MGQIIRCRLPVVSCLWAQAGNHGQPTTYNLLDDTHAASCSTDLMKRPPRALMLASHSRLAVLTFVWLALFAYAGRPLLAGVAAAGLAPTAGWGLLLVLTAIPTFAM